jgi:hypothetical protein
MTDGFEQPVGNAWQRQLIFEALLTVDGDEIDFCRWINPERDRVWQGFASRNYFHATMLGDE